MPSTDPGAPGGRPGRPDAPHARGGPAAPSLPRRLFLPALFLAALAPQLSSCATSPADGSRLASAGSPGEALPLWLPFPGFEGGCCPKAGGHCLAVFSGRSSRPRLEFHALRACLLSPALRIEASGGREGPGGMLSSRVSSFVRDRGLLAGINALPFYPVSGREGEPRENIGIVVSGGRLLSPPHAGFDALVFFEGGGAAVKAQAGMEGIEGIAAAVGGFGRVLAGGEPAPGILGAQARHPRSAAGISPCGRFLYLLAIDGRRPRSVGATLAETALLLRALGASEGINFDGGGSTALALRLPGRRGRERVRVANTPIHRQIPGRERAVAGSLGIAESGECAE